MNNRYSILFVLPFLFTVVVLYLTNPCQEKERKTAVHAINAVIGDESHVAFFGEEPDKDVPDQIRIRTHLLYVEQLLRDRPTDHLSPEQQKNRAHYLDLLRDYIQAGQFPRNDGHPDPRRPTFIDEDGNICAVGYLLEQTVGRQAAESVNKKYKYAFITEIDNHAFKKWVRKSGFTLKELAMIQPMYGSIEKKTVERNVNHVKSAYGTGSTLLAAANGLYMSNRTKDPWMLQSSKTTHWFGLAAGVGSVVLGSFNLDNTRTYPKPGVFTICYDSCTITEIKETNHLRTGVSVANIAVGMVSVIRSAYHLLNSQNSKPAKPQKTEFNLTYIQTGATPFGDPIPGLRFKYRF